jgi:RNA polymerase sigma factor (sigma-70 family)
MDSSHDGFLDRYLPVQRSLYAYVRASGYDILETEDLTQEVALILWKQYGTYDAARSFEGWAIGVARNVIRTRRRHDRVRAGMIVDTEVCNQIADTIAAELETNRGVFDQERPYVEECYATLPEHSRNMFHLRNMDALSIGEVAQRTGKTYAAVAMALSRIRDFLLDCVAKKMAEVRP